MEKSKLVLKYYQDFRELFPNAWLVCSDDDLIKELIDRVKELDVKLEDAEIELDHFKRENELLHSLTDK